MRNAYAVAALSSCLALPGCMSSLHIKSAPLNLKDPKGLPFYAKVGACQQQSVWLEYRYQISAEGFGPVMLSQADYDKVAQGISTATSASMLDTVFKNAHVGAISPFVSDGDASALTAAKTNGNLVLSANTGTLIAIVDYSNPMWLNSGRPLTGTTQVSGTFSADGTLTTASAQVNDQTLSTILTAVSSIADTAISKTFAAAPKTFQVTVAVSARVHTHTTLTPLDEKTASLPAALGACNAPNPPIENGSWTVTDAVQSADTSGKKDSAKKPSDKPAGGTGSN